MKKIALIVEADFYKIHVGVRRVTQFYWRKLQEQGHAVTLVTSIDGKIAVSSEAPLPNWSADCQFTWQKKRNTALEDFDETIVTAPWILASHDNLASHISVGIVHDMVPNFLALGILQIPGTENIYPFAFEHGKGYEAYIKNAQQINCGSESTRQDFIQLYGNAVRNKVKVCTPFSDFGDGTIIQNSQPDCVLLINVLDYRKNFYTVLKTLMQLAGKKNLRVIIIGQERMPFIEVQEFFNALKTVCEQVEWFRTPSDHQVEQIMQRAKVLFFPSIYEGLGFPILEAQAKGIPVISSNNSSCGEINQNPGLTANPYDHSTFANLLSDVLENKMTFLSGQALRDQQLLCLQERNKICFDSPPLENF